MLRFAVAITIIEVLLTGLAAWWVTAAESTTAHLTERDLRELGIGFGTLTPLSTRSGDVANHETRVSILDPVQSLYVSLRTGQTSTDYEFRRGREEALQKKPDRGEMSMIDEPLPGELGYAVRHSGPKSLRFELVRLRGSEMLIVRLSMDRPGPGEMARAERRARKVQERVMGRIGWGLDR